MADGAGLFIPRSEVGRSSGNCATKINLSEFLLPISRVSTSWVCVKRCDVLYLRAVSCVSRFWTDTESALSTMEQRHRDTTHIRITQFIPFPLFPLLNILFLAYYFWSYHPTICSLNISSYISFFYNRSLYKYSDTWWAMFVTRNCFTFLIVTIHIFIFIQLYSSIIFFLC